MKQCGYDSMGDKIRLLINLSIKTSSETLGQTEITEKQEQEKGNVTSEIT